MIVHLLVGSMYGVVAMFLAFFILRRVILRHSENASVWYLILIAGSIGTAIGMYKSYASDEKARKRRKQ